MFKGLENALLGILIGIIILDVVVVFAYNRLGAKLDAIAELLKNK